MVIIEINVLMQKKCGVRKQKSYTEKQMLILWAPKKNPEPVPPAYVVLFPWLLLSSQSFLLTPPRAAPFKNLGDLAISTVSIPPLFPFRPHPPKPTVGLGAGGGGGRKKGGKKGVLRKKVPRRRGGGGGAGTTFTAGEIGGHPAVVGKKAREKRERKGGRGRVWENAPFFDGRSADYFSYEIFAFFLSLFSYPLCLMTLSWLVWP